MQPLKTYHSPSHSLFIEMVIVGMVLFQQQYQSLCLAVGFDLQVSGVNMGVSGHCSAEQLVSPDCHPKHVKGVVVFCKSTIPLCLNALMGMSPHGLAAFADPFQLSLSPKNVFAEPKGNSCPLPVLLLHSLYGHLICVLASDAVPRGCVHVRVGHIIPR